ncbi:hypothetical protein [Actinoplanes sp. OR16]|uniref:hypothetical protein n=1 Tax=Actinoplanes sp. OR16 TaxID=946334 RepID=UPI000FD9DBB9|nr:hypothetical protein [Actinoplanes sp. OR16]
MRLLSRSLSRVRGQRAAWPKTGRVITKAKVAAMAIPAAGAIGLLGAEQCPDGDPGGQDEE